MDRASRRQPPSPKPSQTAAYADLFDRLSDVALLLEPGTWRIIEANPACEQILQIAPERLQDRVLTELACAEKREELAKALRVSMRRYHPRVFEATWRVTDHGPDFQMEVQACPVKLSDGSEILQVTARDVGFRKQWEQQMKAMLAEQSRLLAELQSANSKLEELSNSDGMTGLCNFRHFKELLASEHVRADRYVTPYSIVFCDIDHFKHYNDRNGHPAGDELLKKFAAILTRCCRNTDIPARYGGEEFVVLCPGVEWEGAAVLAERIRTQIAAASFPNGEHQPGGKVTVSVGVASFPLDGKTAEQVLKSADNAMYHSKTHGRNQVSCAQRLKSTKAA